MQQQDERLRIITPAVRKIAKRGDMFGIVGITDNLAMKKQLRSSLLQSSILFVSVILDFIFSGGLGLYRQYDVDWVVARARYVANKSRGHQLNKLA